MSHLVPLVLLQASTRAIVLLWCTGGLLLAACAQRPAELSLTTYDDSIDQRMVAELYSKEAAQLRQMSEDLTHRILVYERLFGPDSDWVKGTRLLAQTYADAAREKEREAEVHFRLAGERNGPRSARSDSQ